MTKPLTRIHNAETGEIIDREMTNEEIKKYEQANQEIQELKNEWQLKNNARSSALAKLAALGLTEDEIAAL